MKRRWFLVLFLCMITLVACESGFSSKPQAPQATIRAYQTQVKQLQSQIGKQHATMSALTPPAGTPIPPAFTQQWKLSISGQPALKPNVGAVDDLTPTKAHGIYLVIPISVVNLSNTPTYFNPLNDLYVIDGKKKEYGLDPNATSAAYVLDFHGDPSLSVLQPGISYPMVLVFDIAKDASNLTLKSHDGSFSARVGV